MTIRLALQISNFCYGTGVNELFPTVIAQAQEADKAGFDSVFLMDHFYQLPMLGTPDQPMLEAYTALGGLATVPRTCNSGLWSPATATATRRSWRRPSPPST